MKKAYSVNVRRSKTACIFVVAESADEAETLALRDIECIYESDFDDDGDEVECEYNCEINELEPDLKLYDENLVRRAALVACEDGGEGHKDHCHENENKIKVHFIR